MNPYPQNKSVLILDNCAIHKSAGCLLIFLPPYFPDLNPIEENFSAGKHLVLMVYSISHQIV